MGYEVIGIVCIYKVVVELVYDRCFDLIFVDIQLVDGLFGIDVVNELMIDMVDVFVIFIIVFLECLLIGDWLELVFLILKFYFEEQVCLVVSQVMFFVLIEGLIVV